MLKRVLTAVVGVSLVWWILHLQFSIPFGILVVLLALAAVYELRRLMQWGKVHTFLATFAVLGWVVLAYAPADVSLTTLYMGCLAAWGLGIGAAAGSKKLPWLSWASIFWVAAPLASILVTHVAWVAGMKYVSTELPAMPVRMLNPVLMTLVPVWAGDTAALLVGKAIGKRKMAPKISPNKTWEGSIAYLLAAVIAALGLGLWYPMDWGAALLCGLAAGVMGQVGDLFESWIKRSYDTKDTGSLLPGHGGILDRIDSLSFSAIASCLTILVVDPGLFQVTHFSFDLIR